MTDPSDTPDAPAPDSSPDTGLTLPGEGKQPTPIDPTTDPAAPRPRTSPLDSTPTA